MTRRPREDQVVWMRRVNQFKLSGKSAKDWTKEQNLSYTQLLRWLRKLSRENNTTSNQWTELTENSAELRWGNVRIIFSRLDDLKNLGDFLRTIC